MAIDLSRLGYWVSALGKIATMFINYRAVTAGRLSFCIFCDYNSLNNKKPNNPHKNALTVWGGISLNLFDPLGTLRYLSLWGKPTQGVYVFSLNGTLTKLDGTSFNIDTITVC